MPVPAGDTWWSCAAASLPSLSRAQLSRPYAATPYPQSRPGWITWSISKTRTCTGRGGSRLSRLHQRQPDGADRGSWYLQPAGTEADDSFAELASDIALGRMMPPITLPSMRSAIRVRCLPWWTGLSGTLLRSSARALPAGCSCCEPASRWSGRLCKPVQARTRTTGSAGPHVTHCGYISIVSPAVRRSPDGPFAGDQWLLGPELKGPGLLLGEGRIKPWTRALKGNCVLSARS
jgi:hypothetical protein